MSNMSRRLELKKRKVDHKELVKVTEKNIGEVAQNIADTMVAGGENNVWEAVNTMVNIITPNEVVECLYKMVSNLVDCTSYTISNPFVDEYEEVKKAFEEVACSSISGMTRIKALAISKKLGNESLDIKEEISSIGECLIIKRWDKGDINIYNVGESLYYLHCSYPVIDRKDVSENEVLKVLENELI